MSHRALLAAAIILSGTVPAFADFACVQRGLAAIGLDPGPIDGTLGRKTLAAAAIYHQSAPYLPELTDWDVDSWCDALLKEQLAALEPPVDPVSFSPDPPSASTGATSLDAMGATPILGETPEYQVPKWVNNPH